LGDPEDVGSIGLAESIAIAGERFEQMKEAYLPLWAARPEPKFEEFEAWLGAIVVSVVSEIQQLWSGLSDWHTTWFAKHCKESVEKALKKRADVEVIRVRRLEIQRLKNADLITSKGNTEAAVLLRESRQTVRGTRPLLDSALALTSVPETSEPREPSAVPNRRKPDLKTSRDRLAFLELAAAELATLKQDLKKHCTAKGLKARHPKFTIWKHIPKQELQELIDGTPFWPKTFAESLALRKFGITSRETLKKDRRKINRSNQSV